MTENSTIPAAEVVEATNLEKFLRELHWAAEGGFRSVTTTLDQDEARELVGLLHATPAAGASWTEAQVEAVTAALEPKCRGFGLSSVTNKDPGPLPRIIAREFAVAALAALGPAEGHVEPSREAISKAAFKPYAMLVANLAVSLPFNEAEAGAATKFANEFIQHARDAIREAAEITVDEQADNEHVGGIPAPAAGEGWKLVPRELTGAERDGALYELLREIVDEFGGSIEQYHKIGPDWTHKDGTEVFSVGVLLDRSELIERARAALADNDKKPLHKASGWKLVPREPTKEMCFRGKHLSGFRNIWAAMYDAAPAHPAPASPAPERPGREGEGMGSVGTSPSPTDETGGGAEKRRGPVEYRGWLIEHNPPPIPSRCCDWQFWHRDYDGPEDGRCGAAGSLVEAKCEIDEREDG